MDRDIIFFVGAPGAGKTNARWWTHKVLGDKFDFEFVNDGRHLVDIIEADIHHEHHFHPDPESRAFCITTTYPADEMRCRVRNKLLKLEEGKIALVELSGGIGDWHPNQGGEKQVDISYTRFVKEKGLFPKELLDRAIFVEIKTRDKDRIAWNEERKGAPRAELHRMSFYVPTEAMEHLFAHDDFEEGLKPFLEEIAVPIIEVKNFGTFVEFWQNSIEATKQIRRYLVEGEINIEHEGHGNPERRF